MNYFFTRNSKISKSPGDWGSKHIQYEKQILDDYGMHRNGNYYEHIIPDITVSKQDNFNDLLADKNVQEAISFISKK
ncbi:hypothetical protein [Chryseobacterium vrystaatense]|uniref:Uncharacterized protein n=1 Tax=Chryseobacterium vrystaatense TaxID=307480 RepID=A0A1M5G7G7_9FLAO|nr:hypothetical protein [Chryseobacterium vrystaatense]SHF99717.1 hypothetical protein SAMN02787073_3261 [Chryseobacterium vrystaatense]